MKKKYVIYLSALIVIIFLVVLALLITKKISFAQESNKQSKIDNSKSRMNIEIPLTKQDISKQVDIDKIIENNEKDIITEKIEKKETDIEFNTQYRENNSLAKGKLQTIQEGQDGKQNATIKNIYKNGQLISSTQLASDVTKASIDKIVEIGTAAFSNSYVPIVGDELQATSVTLAIKQDPNENSDTLVTINKGEKVTLKAKQDDWYYIQYGNTSGWVKNDCVVYVDPRGGSDGDENNFQYTREQLTQDLGFSMLLNKRSGLTIEQFKKIFENDSDDENHIFKENAEFFYYAEQQYNLNGIFLAALAIHESGFGTSSIAVEKKNLFGYQAYDRDPYGSAASFATYGEGIDLVARVLVKYYLNPKGTPIYGGEVADGSYYHGSTVTAVNVSYATDKNWANAVYKWMLYLYNKL